MICEICKVTTGKFVRDHNHKTGFVRGILCNICNSYLGTYEKVLAGQSNSIKNPVKYLRWIEISKISIETYLNKGDTTIVYEGTFGSQAKYFVRIKI